MERNIKLSFLSLFISLIIPTLILGPVIPEILLILSIFIFFLLNFKHKDYKYYNNFFFIIFLLFSFLIIIVSFFSVNIMLSLENSLFYIRFIIYSLIIWYLFDNSELFKKIFFFLIFLSIFILSIDSIFQFYFKYNVLGFPYEDYRASSFFGKEKIMGSYIVRLLPIYTGLYILLFNYKNSNLSFFYFSSLFLFTFAILISGERSAFFLSIMLIFFIYLFVKFNFKIKVFFLILIIFVNTFLLIYSNSLRDRFIKHTLDEFIYHENKYAIFSIYHTSHYVTAINMFLDNPLFGKGAKTFRVLCSTKKFEVKLYNLKNEYKNNAKNMIGYKIFPNSNEMYKYREVGNGCTTHPHNIYIQLLAETGIFGFMIYFSIFLYSLYVLITSFFNKYIKKINTISSFNLIIFVSVFINFWPLIPTGSIFSNWMNYIYFLPIGILLSSFFSSKHYFYVFKK